MLAVTAVLIQSAAFSCMAATPPVKAPNVVVILADDMGFNDIQPFGQTTIATPALNELAEGGMRFTNFHTHATCSPTRAQLLTGVDNHRAGMGSMGEYYIPEMGKYPGSYIGAMNDRVKTIAEVLKEHGYATFMTGKWHLGGGGLDQATYAWGNLFKPDDETMGNTWDNAAVAFPVQAPKVQPGTLPVGTFPVNGYNLHDMAGNAWQWVADWYRTDAFVIQAVAKNVTVNPLGPATPFDPEGLRADAPKRVIRGGSFLCSEAYCEGYRVSARQGQDPYSSSSNVGFRLAVSAAEWAASRKSRASNTRAARHNPDSGAGSS